MKKMNRQAVHIVFLCIICGATTTESLQFGLGNVFDNIFSRPDDTQTIAPTKAPSKVLSISPTTPPSNVRSAQPSIEPSSVPSKVTYNVPSKSPLQVSSDPNPVSLSSSTQENTNPIPAPSPMVQPPDAPNVTHIIGFVVVASVLIVCFIFFFTKNNKKDVPLSNSAPVTNPIVTPR